MSDHIEESLKNAACDSGANPQVRVRLDRARRTRMTKAMTVSGLSVSAVVGFALIAAPRQASAQETYDQVSRAFKDWDSVRITMFARPFMEEKEGNRSTMSLSKGAFVSFSNVGAVNEEWTRTNYAGTITWFPKLNLAQRHAPGSIRVPKPMEAREDLLAYVQKSFVTNPAEFGPSATPLTPSKVVRGIKRNGKVVIRLEFPVQAINTRNYIYELYADEKTNLPIELISRNEPQRKDATLPALETRYVFERETNPAVFSKQIPPTGIAVVDMAATQEDALRLADISPEFGGIKRAFRGPEGSLLVVSKEDPVAETKETLITDKASVANDENPGYKPNGVFRVFDFGGKPWRASTWGGSMKTSAGTTLHATLLVPIDPSEGSWTALPFPVESALNGWTRDAAGFMDGWSLTSEYAGIVTVRSSYHRMQGDIPKAKQILTDGLKNADKLPEYVVAGLKRSLTDMEKKRQR